jgi:hypothetical protein
MEQDMTPLQMTGELIAQRDAALYHPLDNPDRRHEPDGVCVPELPTLGIAIPNPSLVEEAPQKMDRAMILPTDPQERKNLPITTGVLDYFPLAIAEVARVSKAGNDQHNPGQPLHWAKEKSTDHADCIPRHLIDRYSRDTDGQRHAAKMAWRALAFLQMLLEAEQ